jgi:hypothetical protein
MSFTPMNPMLATLSSAIDRSNRSQTDSIRERLRRITGDLLVSLPAIEQLSAEGRRGIIARYSAVLEGNFIYWMTGAFLAARRQETRAIIEDNLLEEVRDCHPGMLRKFALAAHAVPSHPDAQAVYPQLSAVRLFVGKLSPAPLIAMMCFFENFIQEFMAYLAELAKRQGSGELEYTDVHGVCDIAHSRELFRALEMEMAIASDSDEPAENIFEGVYLLRALIQVIVADPVRSAKAFPNVN